MRPAPIIDTLWPDGTFGFIAGPPKAGKSSYALEEALCLATGWPVFGQYHVTSTKRVLFIEEEDESTKVQERIEALIRQREFSVSDLNPDTIRFMIGEGFKADDAACLEMLDQIISQHGIEVVYLDALWRMVEDPSLERASEILRAVAGITKINQELGTAFRVLHHATKKTGRVASGTQLLGGPTLRGWARSSLMFGEPTKGSTTISYEGKGGFTGPVCRMRVLATAATPTARSLFEGLEWVALTGTTPAPEAALSRREESVLQLVRQAPRTRPELVRAGQELGIARSTLYGALDSLRTKGRAIENEGGVWCPAEAAR